MIHRKRRLSRGHAAPSSPAACEHDRGRRWPWLAGTPVVSNTRSIAIGLLAASLAIVGLAAADDPDGTPSAGGAGYIRIEGAIDRLQSRYLTRALDDARAAGLSTIVVHLDTDGGQVHYAREMFKTILDSRANPAGDDPDAAERNAAISEEADGSLPRMIAFVDFRALSAGAMIAYAHHEIHVTDGASIGDIGVNLPGLGRDHRVRPGEDRDGGAHSPRPGRGAPRLAARTTSQDDRPKPEPLPHHAPRG